MSDMAGWGGDGPAERTPARDLTEVEVLQVIAGEMKETNAHLLTIKWVLVITMIVVPVVFWIVVAVIAGDTSSGSGF